MDEYIGTYSYHPNYISCYSPGCFMSVFEHYLWIYIRKKYYIWWHTQLSFASWCVNIIHNSASLRLYNPLYSTFSNVINLYYTPSSEKYGLDGIKSLISRGALQQFNNFQGYSIVTERTLITRKKHILYFYLLLCISIIKTIIGGWSQTTRVLKQL